MMKQLPFTILLPIIISALALAQPAQPPNIVVILADDLSYDLLEFMPQTQALLAEPGAVFTNYFVTQALCCPSRASILRGQYPHNHGIFDNAPPDGGFVKVAATGIETSTLAVWLQDAGYTTGYIGKYFNGYKADDVAYTPPGWDVWKASCKGNYSQKLVMCENGLLVKYGKSLYETDLLSLKATEFIATVQEPSLTIISTYAPHVYRNGPPIPAERHKNLFNGATVPRTEAFNEADVSDKPSWIQATPLLTETQVAFIDSIYEGRLEAIQAIDDMVGDVVETLTATGRLSNTIIILTSDNGLQLGEHRLWAKKNFVYEESIRVPLVIRGPGIVPGVYDHLTANIDLAPTIAQWAGAAVPGFVDGRLLSDTTRTGLLIETYPPNSNSPDRFYAVRTICGVYAEYANGETERYDLRSDPQQLNSLPGDDGLSGYLHDLETCEGEECRIMENSVPPCQ